jgi:hypothetical protein
MIYLLISLSLSLSLSASHLLPAPRSPLSPTYYTLASGGMGNIQRRLYSLPFLLGVVSGERECADMAWHCMACVYVMYAMYYVWSVKGYIY